MLNERTIDIMKENDIKVYDREEQDGEFYREIEFYSPKGEDVIETVWYDGTDEGFIKAFAKNARNFDVDEYAEMWIDNRYSVGGVPNSIRDLIDDAEAIKKILLDVAEQLESEGKENSSTMDI